MKKGIHRIIVAVLAVALTVTMFPLTAFAQDKSTTPAKNTKSKSKRTIMLYDCGSNLETQAGLATYNLMQILASSFSSDDDIKFIVMTGGSHKWQMKNDKLVFPDEVKLPKDAVIEYDSDKREYADEPSDPKSQISNIYNQIWEAKGIDATMEGGAGDPNAGKMVLLDGNGITKVNEAVKSKDELMSDPETLKAFINYGEEYYPADKYDLILWDHGGGPKGGFGSDEHRDEAVDWTLPDIMSFDGIADALSDNNVVDTNNDNVPDGKFDFVNFDACLMNSVELALAMADYTDYYIASAETEPGYGQYYGPCAERDGKQYKGWLDELGDPDNDEKYNGKDGTYELGKVIVDDFYNFYEKETGDGSSQEGTLAVIDTKKMMDSEFVETLTEMARWLKNGAGNIEEDGLHFYDELKSYYNSIEYGGSELFDLGNLSALLSVVNSEVSEDHMDEEDNYYINANDYHDISRTLNSFLANGEFMYAKGTSGIKTKKQYYRTLDDELGYDELGSSGMSIYFPGLGMLTSATDYFREIDPIIDRLPDGDKRKTFLKDYEAVVAYYEMILYSGTVVNLQINDEDNALETVRKSDVKYDMIMKQIKDPVFGNWESMVIPCMNKIGLNEEGIENWFRALIPQQADDAVDGKDVKLERLDQDETGACNVKVDGARKRIVNSVERKVCAELPALDEYISELEPKMQQIVNREGQLSLGSIEGTIVSPPKGDSIRDKIKWYNEKGGVWHIDPFDEKWYAVKDASGAEHVASIYLSDEDGIYVPAFIENSSGEASTPDQLMLEFYPGGDHKLKSVYYMNAETGPVQVEPKNLTGKIKVMTAIVIKQMFDPDMYVPISKSSFTLSAGNADSIRLEFMDVDGIGDIGDVDGDEKALDTSITITDIYGYQVNVSDRVHIKKARIKPAVRTGEELVPELVYRGETLRSGVDYILEKEKVYNKETGHYGVPDFIEPGDYMVSLYGKGRFAGRLYDTIFSIIYSEKDLQSMIDEAEKQLKDAQDAFANLDPNDTEAMKQLFADLFAAQNALTKAQSELERTREILNNERIAELKDQIAQLEENADDPQAGEKIAELEERIAQLEGKTKDTPDKEQISELKDQIVKLETKIEDLNNKLAEISVVDISNYAVTMKTSFPYTGKAIEPDVKVSGVNESCYTVSYSNNTKIGTAKVIIKAKGEKYKGTIRKNFKIVKAANTLKIKGKKVTIKYKKLKKKAKKLSVKKVIRITKKGQGAITYAKASGSKKITINKKTGKVTVKKGLKKGTYKVKVKVKAAGNRNYKASGRKTATIKVRVK